MDGEGIEEKLRNKFFWVLFIMMRFGFGAGTEEKIDCNVV